MKLTAFASLPPKSHQSEITHCLISLYINLLSYTIRYGIKMYIILISSKEKIQV